MKIHYLTIPPSSKLNGQSISKSTVKAHDSHGSYGRNDNEWRRTVSKVVSSSAEQANVIATAEKETENLTA